MLISEIPAPVRRIAIGLACLAVLFLVGASRPGTASATPKTDVEATFDRLTARQRVGQLFLVAFYARPEDPWADVLQLISEDGIGGVVLQRGNGVFENDADGSLPGEIRDLTRRLQYSAMRDGPGVPLFIAADHEGDLHPFTHLREGFTAIPSPMAIGATWDSDAAATVGRIVGRELDAVGVNMLLGPGLDVLADPRTDSGGDIGTRAFGGHPFWVSKMGAAYIRGVHEGADWRVATVAKHFPGHGGSDRNPDRGISTVTKPLNALETIELAPFAAVTSDVPGDRDRASVTDAMMTSHIRYRGIQGNLQDATPPISFDPEGMALLLEGGRFGFDAWREAGGLIVSDSLGVPAVRDWFDPGRTGFPNRLIARSALMAGNDVLILAQFADIPAWDPALQNVRDTIDYFEGEYRRDPTFRARVDRAARRILQRKSRIAAAEEVRPRAEGTSSTAPELGRPEDAEVVAEIARSAVTTWTRPPSGPERGDRIVVITPRRVDPASGALISEAGPLSCRSERCGLPEDRWRRLLGLGPTLVEGMMLERFGPLGTHEISPADVHSLAFCQLRQALTPDLVGGDVETGGPPSSPTTNPAVPRDGRPMPGRPCDSTLDGPSVLARLSNADWVVFAFADLDPDEALGLRGFLLPQVINLARIHDARVGVLSFGPPYYIDTTNLAQLDAHYAAYTKIPAAIEASVTAWFGARQTDGRSPVAVENADYALDRQLEPDPDAPLVVDRVGDGPIRDTPVRIALEIDGLIDRNGHPVPDGTVVRISAEPPGVLPGGGADLTTVAGTARGDVTLTGRGPVRISASTVSGATSAEPLRIVLPSPSPTPGQTTPENTGGTDAAPSEPQSPTTRRPHLGDFLVNMVTVVLTALAAVFSSTRGHSIGRRLRVALVAGIFGLASYILVAGVGGPRLLSAVGASVPSGLLLPLFSGIGTLVGWSVGWVWVREARSRRARSGTA